MTVQCPECFNTIVSGQNMCFKCGAKLPKNLIEANCTSEPDYSVFNSVNKYKTNENLKYNFNGIYRYDKNGNKKTEVICPRCKSWDCGFYQQEQTKTKYVANINPLKPLTFAEKKEKTKILERYICNKCGKIFD